MTSQIAAEYRVELYLNGKLIGDIRRLAQNLSWAKRRTKVGVDAISFTLNDVQLSHWCKERDTTISQLLKPIALECKVYRNNIPLLGGYLATMPAYQPTGPSADLNLQFDGYFNLLAGVYIYPQPTQTKRLSDMINDWVSLANTRSQTAGKGFGLHAATVTQLPSVTQSYEDYKDIKSLITDRCDNTSGAGEFEFYIDADKNYNVLTDTEFGANTDFVINYPAQINLPSAITFNAPEISGFASCVIGIGNGETSGNSSKDTALTSIQSNSDAVLEYGYAETLLSESSVSVQATLDNNTKRELDQRSTMIWQPEIELSGRQITPAPPTEATSTMEHRLWIGDTIHLYNYSDSTETMSGDFRVNALEVNVDANGGESIKPSISKIGKAVNNYSFAQEFMRMKNQLIALRSAS